MNIDGWPRLVAFVMPTAVYPRRPASTPFVRINEARMQIAERQGRRWKGSAKMFLTPSVPLMRHGDVHAHCSDSELQPTVRTVSVYVNKCDCVPCA